jgi:hypothetical protein
MRQQRQYLTLDNWKTVPGCAYPCDYQVFGLSKKTLKGRRFNSDEAVREAVEQWFIQQHASFFAEGITKLVQRWDK